MLQILIPSIKCHTKAACQAAFIVLTVDVSNFNQ